MPTIIALNLSTKKTEFGFSPFLSLWFSCIWSFFFLFFYPFFFLRSADVVVASGSLTYEIQQIYDFIYQRQQMIIIYSLSVLFRSSICSFLPAQFHIELYVFVSPGKSLWRHFPTSSFDYYGDWSQANILIFLSSKFWQCCYNHCESLSTYDSDTQQMLSAGSFFINSVEHYMFQKKGDEVGFSFSTFICTFVPLLTIPNTSNSFYWAIKGTLLSILSNILWRNCK